MTPLYVSLNGNETWSGRLPEANAACTDGPLATLARAREIVRGLKQVGGVTVTVSGGEYRLAEALAFTAGDSGTAEAPVVYRAAEGEQVRLSGGVQIADWKPVTDAAALKRLPDEARGKSSRPTCAHTASAISAAWSRHRPGGTPIRGWRSSSAANA